MPIVCALWFVFVVICVCHDCANVGDCGGGDGVVVGDVDDADDDYCVQGDVDVGCELRLSVVIVVSLLL